MTVKYTACGSVRRVANAAVLRWPTAPSTLAESVELQRLISTSGDCCTLAGVCPS